MKFTEAIKSVFSKYATFSGRASRAEYWYFTLFNIIVTSILEFVPIVGAIWALAVLVPGLALCCRRLHDIGKSGWWQLIELIPIVGLILMLIWVCKDSDAGDNKYGANPKAPAAAAAPAAEEAKEPWE